MQNVAAPNPKFCPGFSSCLSVRQSACPGKRASASREIYANCRAQTVGQKFIKIGSKSEEQSVEWGQKLCKFITKF